ncbi:unnamed protein product [Cutaneotrichosporon oleaginosum]
MSRSTAASKHHPSTLFPSHPMSPPSPPPSPPPITPSYPSFPHSHNPVASSSSNNLPFGSVRLNPAADHRGAAFNASRDSVAAATKMSSSDRRNWRRAGSIRSKSQPSLQDKPKPQSRPEAIPGDIVDGYVPYRPPYVSTLSLSAPVKPSGAQGIGLAPTPAAPPERERPQKKTIFGWFGRRKAKQKLASVSTPTLIETPPSGSQAPGYPRYGHRPTAAQSADLLGPASSAATTAGGQSGGGGGVTESPSVLTGLVAPKMLFSPLSRSMRTEGVAADHPYGYSYPSSPRIEHFPLHPDRPPYPRVGDNTLTATFPGHVGQRFTTTRRPEDSTVTLHSEGSRSRLTVNTVCDALTFPRPRMHAHEVTPPDTPEFDTTITVDPDDPNSSFDRVYAAGEVREAERSEWAAITRKSRSSSMKSIISRRRSDEWSVREHPGTPVHPSWSRHSLTAGEKPEYTRSKSTASSIRSLFRSGTERFARHTRSHDNLPQQAINSNLSTPVKRSSRPSTAPSLSRPAPTAALQKQPSFPSSSRPSTAPQAPSYTSSRPSHPPSSRRSTGVSESPSTTITGAGVPTTPKSLGRSLPPRSLSLKQRLPKSTSTPSLLLDSEHRVSFAPPQRSRSTRSHNIHSRSNPDLLNYRPALSTTTRSDQGERLGRLPERAGSVREGDRGRHGSPPAKLRRRQTGPPRTFQFRLQPPTHRHAPSGSNLVMVGGATAPDHSRLDSSRLHVKLPPRSIDFASGGDPNRLPTPPPHLPTPERSSPFNYDFPESEIGMAITTDQAVSPVQHRLPMDTPPSSRPQMREDPSSAHARYVLARQHRRQQTMRAFQSPPTPGGGGRRSPDIYPQHRFSQMSMYSQGTTLSSSHSAAHSAPAHSGSHWHSGVPPAPMSPTRFSRPGHSTPPREEKQPAQDHPSVPPSPRSPKTSWFGRPRDSHRPTSPQPAHSVGRGRAMSPHMGEVPVRPRTPPSSWHRRRTSSRDASNVPAVPPLPAGMRTPPRQHIPPSLVRNDEPPIPHMPAEQQSAPVDPPDPPTPPYVPPLPLITASAAVPARPSSMSGRIPPLRRPPSRPPPPTPTPPVGSRTNSTDELPSSIPSRSQSLKSFRSLNDLTAMTTAAPLGRQQTGNIPGGRSSTPPNNDTFSEEATPRPRTAPSGPGPRTLSAATPPAQTGLPTIMDESPTPLRQTRVSVLAGQPPPDTPVGGIRAAVARRSLSGNSGRMRRLSGPPLSAGLVSTAEGSPAANLFGARRATPSPTPLAQAAAPFSSMPASYESYAFPPQVSCWPTTIRGTSTPEVTPVVFSSVSGGSRNQSSSDVQSWDSGETPMPQSSTSTLGAVTPLRRLSDHATIASATSSVSLYSETDDNWVTPAASHEDTDDTDSEGGLSEATLPELFPVSSTSALSHYEDARDGTDDWTVREEDEEDDTRSSEARSITPAATRHSAVASEDEYKSAVTPPPTGPTFKSRSSPSNPMTPTNQTRFTLEDDAGRRAFTPDTDTVESLMITPRAKGRSPRTPGTNATEPFEYDRDRRSPTSSLSSGSEEGSIRNSMDENFRGLFFRTPQVSAPTTTRRPVTAPSTAPSMINPPARSDSRRPGTSPRPPAQPFDDPTTAESTPMVTAESTPVEERQFSFAAAAAAVTGAPIAPKPLTSIHDSPKPLTSIHDRVPKPLTSIYDKSRRVTRASSRSRSALGPPIGLEQASPYADAHAAKRELSIRTSSMDVQPVPFPVFDSSSGPSTNAPPSPAPGAGAPTQARGLGVTMSPLSTSGDASLPGWDSVSRIGASTPPLAALPRDDSWISASFRQAAAKERSATPGVMRDQSKHRVTSEAPSLSPSTFGVSSSTFGASPLVPDQQHHVLPLHEQPPHAKRARFPKGSISSTSSFNIITPHNDVVDRFPSPPRNRPRTG